METDIGIQVDVGFQIKNEMETGVPICVEASFLIKINLETCVDFFVNMSVKVETGAWFPCKSRFQNVRKRGNRHLFIIWTAILDLITV